LLEIIESLRPVAVESRDSAARIAFRQMATEWARLAFNEEFIFR
jgi:hypothetical protein